MASTRRKACQSIERNQVSLGGGGGENGKALAELTGNEDDKFKPSGGQYGGRARMWSLGKLSVVRSQCRTKIKNAQEGRDESGTQEFFLQGNHSCYNLLISE